MVGAFIPFPNGGRFGIGYRGLTVDDELKITLFSPDRGCHVDCPSDAPIQPLAPQESLINTVQFAEILGAGWILIFGFLGVLGYVWLSVSLRKLRAKRIRMLIR